MALAGARAVDVTPCHCSMDVRWLSPNDAEERRADNVFPYREPGADGWGQSCFVKITREKPDRKWTTTGVPIGGVR